MTTVQQNPIQLSKTRKRPFEDLSGKTFGRWTVGTSKKIVVGDRRRTGWLCRCACGTKRWIDAKTLKKGASQSCGCGKVTHGLTTIAGKHPLYIAWVGMWTRCTNDKEPQWKDYGGRGITVCDRWKDVQAFIDDMMPTWKPGLSIDRKENNGNYCPENCRWASRAEQNRNRRNTVRVKTPEGDLCVCDAIRKYGVVTYTAALYRIKHGWDPWKAMTTPRDSKPAGEGGVDTPDGLMSPKAAAERFGLVSASAVHYRIKQGWDPWIAIITPYKQPNPLKEIQ